MPHFLVIGATGPSGLIFLETALQSNNNNNNNSPNTFTIFCRNPSKLPPHIHSLSQSSSSSSSSPPKIQIITGEFTDLSALTRALHTGATILISFAGPAIPGKGTAITDFYKTLFPLIKQDSQTRISRVLILSTPSFRVVEDKFSLKWWLGVQFVYWLFGDAWEEVNGIGKVVTGLRDEEENKLEWTVFRVPGLTKAAAGPVRAGFIGERGDGLLLSRKSLAVWVLQEVEERKWVGRCPALSDA